MPQQQPQKQQQRGRSARRTAANRPFAEIRVRDTNMKMQLQLASACAKFDRDKMTWNRGNEKSERNLLIDLARMMDGKLTPSVDDWFDKRRVRQASCLPDLPGRRARRGSGSGDADNPGSDDDDEDVDSAMRLLDRQRILEAKRADWLGVTSVPRSFRPRPVTAAAAGPAAAASSATSGPAGAAATPADGAGAPAAVTSSAVVALPTVQGAARPRTAALLKPSRLG